MNTHLQQLREWMMHSKRRNVLVALLYATLAVLVMRGLLFTPGTIGLRNDWSIAPFPIQYQARMQQALVNWSPDYLGTALVRRTDLLLTTVLWLVSTIFNVGGPLFSKAIPVLAFTGAGFFVFRLLRYLGARDPGAFAGGVLYMFSPLMFNLMVFGQHHFLVGYALYPLLVHLFLRTLAAARPLPWVLGTGTVFAFALSQDTFLVIGGLTLLVLAIGNALARRQEGGRPVVRNLLLFAGVTLLVLLWHAPTVLSVAAHARAAREAFQLLSVAWNTWLSPEMIDALSLEGSGIRSFLDAVTVNRKPWWMLTNTAVLLLVFSAVFLPRKRRLMLSLAAGALLTIFIFKGVHAPLGKVNEWLYAYVPGMIVFRNLQYVTVFSHLIFAVLLAHVVTHGQTVAGATAQTARQRRRWRLAYAGVLVVLLLKAGPFFTGDFNAGVQVYVLGEEHEEVYTRLYRDPDDYRVLWLPPVQPMTYKSTPHAGLDPFGSQSPKPSIIDNPVHPINWLVNMVVYTRPETNLGELLRTLGVRYVVYRDDLVSRTPLFQWGEFPKDEWTNDQLKRWLAGQTSLVLDQTYGDGAIAVYRHTVPRPRLDTAGSVGMSTGDLSDEIWLADYWPTDGSGTRDSLYTSQMHPQDPGILSDVVSRTMIVNNNFFDLTLLFLGDAATHLQIPHLFRDTKDGWSQNWPWKDWRYASLLDPAVFTVKAYETTVPFVSEELGRASLWVKTYHSAKGATLRFALDGRPLKSIDLAEEALQGPQWHELRLGALSAGAHELTVTSGEGENVIARMVLTSEEAVAEAERKATAFLTTRELYLSLNLDFRDAPAYTSVPSRKTRTDALFTDADLPLEVPATGTYDLALHASGGAYVSQEQRESDSYQTIERGKTVGQTFTVALTDSRIERVQVSAEARTLATNSPSPVMPDAPLRAQVFRVGGAEKILVGEATISPSAAGINDAWKLVDANVNIVVEREGDPFPEYLVEFATDATNVVWAVRTVQNGFRGRGHYYEQGKMVVNGQVQPGDMAFTVIARSEDAKLDAIAVDGTPLPSEDFTVPWQNRTTLSLVEGTHTVSLRGVRSHTADVQLMLRLKRPVNRPLSPPLTVDRHGITQLTTKTIRASHPYLLVFAEAFDPRWRAEVTTDDGETSVVPDEARVAVNGYANGWLISAPGPHTLRIAYAPQRAYRAGLFLSGSVALAVAVLLSWYGLRHLRRRLHARREVLPNTGGA